jgi:hypothetical protein
VTIKEISCPLELEEGGTMLKMKKLLKEESIPLLFIGIGIEYSTD